MNPYFYSLEFLLFKEDEFPNNDNGMMQEYGKAVVMESAHHAVNIEKENNA